MTEISKRVQVGMTSTVVFRYRYLNDAALKGPGGRLSWPLALSES